MSRDELLGPLFRVATARRRAEAVRDKSAAALDRVFGALEAKGLDPQLTSDGRGITATCPCCNGRRALIVEIPNAGEGTQ